MTIKVLFSMIPNVLISISRLPIQVKKVLFFMISIVLLLFIHSQYRHFYKVDNITFTVWKQWGGDCYITPYKYWGIFSPNKNFIKAPNLGVFLVFIEKDSTLNIFDNVENLRSLEINLIDFKYNFFSPNWKLSDEVLPFYEKIEDFRKRDLSSLSVEMRDMYVILKNKH